MLDDKGKELVANSYDLVRMVVSKHHRLFPILPKEELESICYLALCTAADRWESYCAERGFDPGNVDYFNPYAFRRMDGAINDKLREMDPLSRAQRKEVKSGEKDISEIAGGKMGGYLLAPDPEMLNQVMETNPSAHSQVVTQTLLDVLVEFYKEQPYQTQVILALYYYKEMLLQNIADELGVTESFVSKKHSEFIVELRHRLKKAAS